MTDVLYFRDGYRSAKIGDKWKISWTNWCVSGKNESSNVTFGAGTGNWSAADLSQDGTWTRNLIRSYPYPTVGVLQPPVCSGTIPSVTVSRIVRLDGRTTARGSPGLVVMPGMNDARIKTTDTHQ